MQRSDFSEAEIPFGHPIPANDEHAISVALRKWAQVIGYEEADAAIVEAMKTGYPRFFVHKYVAELFAFAKEKFANDGEEVFVFPSYKTAKRCREFVGGGKIESCGDGLAALIVPDIEAWNLAKKFAQHTGKIVSSRRAKRELQLLQSGQRPEGVAALARYAGGEVSQLSPKQELKKIIASYHDVDPNNVYLGPTGMASVDDAFNAATHGANRKQTIQLGFPYVDLHQLQQKFGDDNQDCYLRYDGPDDLAAVKERIGERTISAVICEVPGNPLLKTIDLERLSSILRANNIPLIVDNTLGTPQNIDVMRYADVVVTSLTKFFSGVGNVMGGSLVLNKHSPHYDRLKANIDKTYEDLLDTEDAQVLLDNSREFDDRMLIINDNAYKLAQFLKSHPAIDTVYYTDGDPAYEALCKEKGGYGGLLSFTLKDPEKNAELVYDALRIAKGPSLGKEFTLGCPIALLANYGELEWAEQQGVSRNIIRVSVGTEQIEEIIARFKEALDCALTPEQRNNPGRSVDPTDVRLG